MKDPTADWVEKAEGDYWVMVREARVTDRHSFDAVCFHAQQCVEKYAKAFLQERVVEFERIHDMGYLNSKCASVDLEFEVYKVDFKLLDSYSVDIRYPGESAAESDARAAVAIALRLREFIRGKLGLTPQ